MTDSNTPPTPNQNEPLQFDRVEGAGASPESMSCASCSKPIAASYWDVDGKHVCEMCKELATQANQPARGFKTFLKALVLGGIACLVGAAIYYGVAAAFNLEIGLIAILIGFMVGAAVRIGTGGRGGRKYQLLAAFLTYFAVGLAYTPFALKGAMQGSRAHADSLRAAADTSSADADTKVAALEPVTIPPVGVTLAGDSARPATSPEADTALADSALADADSSAVALSPGGFAAGLALIFGGGFLLVFALPILAIVSDMPGGLISALIIGFGILQAWNMTGARVAKISGPYRVGGNPGTA